MTEHTPTPWHLEIEKIGRDESQRIAISRGATLIAHYETDFVEYPETDEENAANAAFIVRAVNCHAELVAALEACAEHRLLFSVRKKVEAALAKARGETL